jgi:LmbE family N-acetylglucosaminyl deacetylase
MMAYVPQLRPHNQLRGRKLFFMISRRPLLELSTEEVLLYNSIDGRKTVAELEGIYPGAGDRLLRWHEAEIVELIPPITPPANPHLVVIEPHMDDAALSVGGRLLHRRGYGRITIVSVVRWSNYTSYLKLKRNFQDVRVITDLRQQESALATRLLGAEHRYLDWTDAPLRFVPAERWSPATIDRFDVAQKAFAYLFPDPGEVSLIAKQLLQKVSDLAPDELWIPMGLGDHVDHRTTRSACLLMLAEARDRFSGLPVVMYEDLPYAAESGHAAQICAALAQCGTHLVRCAEDITDVLGEKLRVISIYASQFKISFMEPRIRAVAERESGTAGQFAEAYHRVEREPCLPLESRLSPDCAGLALLQTHVCALLVKRMHCHRVTVIALPSGHLGRWKTDQQSLVAAFPNADVRVYAAENLIWQAEEGGSGRLSLTVVRGRWGWVGAIWRELFRIRTPTVVLWWGAYDAGLKKKLIMLLLPFRHLLFAKTLCDFCGVLNEKLGKLRQ